MERFTNTQIVARCNDVAVLRFKRPSELKSGYEVKCIPHERFSQMKYYYMEEQG